MKKILKGLLLSISLFTIHPLQAELDILVEARAAAFFPSSNQFRKIYGTCLGSYQIEAKSRFNECFDAWSNVDFVFQNGRSIQLHNSTRINIINYSLGLSYLYLFCEDFTAYIGVGPSFGYVTVHNRLRSHYESGHHQHSSHSKESKFAMGGVIKTGIIYDITCGWTAELFFDYLYQPVSFKENIDIGGSKLGGGLGYRF